jgi:hypothetical protein
MKSHLIIFLFLVFYQVFVISQITIWVFVLSCSSLHATTTPKRSIIEYWWSIRWCVVNSSYRQLPIKTLSFGCESEPLLEACRKRRATKIHIPLVFFHVSFSSILYEVRTLLTHSVVLFFKSTGIYNHHSLITCSHYYQVSMPSISLVLQPTANISTLT